MLLHWLLHVNFTIKVKCIIFWTLRDWCLVNIYIACSCFSLAESKNTITATMLCRLYQETETFCLVALTYLDAAVQQSFYHIQSPVCQPLYPACIFFWYGVVSTHCRGQIVHGWWLQLFRVFVCFFIFIDWFWYLVSHSGNSHSTSIFFFFFLISQLLRDNCIGDFWSPNLLTSIILCQYWLGLFRILSTSVPQKQELRDFSETGRVKTSEFKPFVANLVLLSSNRIHIVFHPKWTGCIVCFCFVCVLCCVFFLTLVCGIGKVGQLSKFLGLIHEWFWKKAAAIL